jgi:hypothetical protein
MRKGLIVAACQVAIVSSLGAKLLVDRATCPRVWARTAPVDPNLPIRGRYVSFRLEAAPGEGFRSNESEIAPSEIAPVALSAKDGTLRATREVESTLFARITTRDGMTVAALVQPLAYFIPEHAPDPSIRKPGEELWAEVTVPRKGAPRPIRLGVKKGGVLIPLDLR